MQAIDLHVVVITIADGVGDELPHQGPVNHRFLQLWPRKAKGHQYTWVKEELNPNSEKTRHQESLMKRNSPRYILAAVHYVVI